MAHHHDRSEAPFSPASSSATANADDDSFVLPSPSPPVLAEVQAPARRGGMARQQGYSINTYGDSLNLPVAPRHPWDPARSPHLSAPDFDGWWWEEEEEEEDVGPEPGEETTNEMAPPSKRPAAADEEDTAARPPTKRTRRAQRPESDDGPRPEEATSSSNVAGPPRPNNNTPSAVAAHAAPADTKGGKQPRQRGPAGGPEQTCSSCRESKPSTEFWVGRGRALLKVCIKCRNSDKRWAGAEAETKAEAKGGAPRAPKPAAGATALATVGASSAAPEPSLPEQTLSRGPAAAAATATTTEEAPAAPATTGATARPTHRYTLRRPQPAAEARRRRPRSAVQEHTEEHDASPAGPHQVQHPVRNAWVNPIAQAPLPHGWERRETPTGQVFYTNGRVNQRERPSPDQVSRRD